MNDRPPFDPVKASFILVAGVIATECVVVIASVAFCWTQGDDAVRCSDLRGRLIEMLTAALATALAFSGRGKSN